MYIRNYTPKDFKMLSSWWADHNEPGPIPEMLPEESTFVLEDRGTPVMSVSVYLTNSCIGYVENFIKCSGYDNKDAAVILNNHIQDFAKSRGVKIHISLSYREQLSKRYQELGYMNTLNNLSGFVKHLEVI